ncbi:MAG TPA: carboxypeptidase-like regulatory domain-containing protein [Fimbriimonadaceae bacterium]|nr:carboxypeptidase-like regulatory domain-containing protein [Fimbriimonadaceae bacterium]
MKARFLVLPLMGLILAGCGGNGPAPVGDITGFVQDINGGPVSNALVYLDGGPQTYSNSAGSYRLSGGSGDVRTIKARVSQGGVDYVGQNTVQIFDGETSKSTNITVVPSNQTATFGGTVYDRNGDLVEFAHVFATATQNGNPTVWSSCMVLTDSNGNFTIPDLLGGHDYSIIASAAGFDSDTDTVNIPAGQTSSLNFTLKNPTDPLLSPPSNLEAIAWTTPYVATTRIAGQQSAYENIKNYLYPRRAQFKKVVQTRDTSTGNFVEIDLDWSPMSDPSLIGYNIYRAPGSVGTGSLRLVDFYRDPAATLYEDLDSSFQENQTYSYAMTSLNTNAPDTNNSESAFSTVVTTTTLPDTNFNPVTFGPVTFNWNLVSGADTYEVLVFDEDPSIGISAIWTGTSSGTSLAYGGPALTSGHTYYFVIKATGYSGASVSLSPIGSFAAP